MELKKFIKKYQTPQPKLLIAHKNWHSLCVDCRNFLALKIFIHTF